MINGRSVSRSEMIGCLFPLLRSIHLWVSPTGCFSPPDDVFSEDIDPAWMARLSLPLAADYHDNIFVPNGPPSPESEILPAPGLDSSSFSTFGKTLKTQDGGAM